MVREKARHAQIDKNKGQQMREDGTELRNVSFFLGSFSWDT